MRGGGPIETNILHCGDALTVLRGLPDNAIQCVVTSPPYWGLRDYGNGKWQGGDPACSHALKSQTAPLSSTLGGGKGSCNHAHDGRLRGDAGGVCECGARWSGDGIGLEPTFDEYLARIVAVFREVRRVLRDDGTLWLNMGDSYASSWPCNRRNQIGSGSLPNGKREARPPRLPRGLKDKDLIGQPWRVAFALQAGFSACNGCGLELRTDLWPIRTGHRVCWDCRGDSKIIQTELGWYLRSDIIWSKNNPMPESVTDRPAKSHEYLFLMTKNSRYYYNADAVREPYLLTSNSAEGDALGRTRRGRNIPSKRQCSNPTETICPDWSKSYAHGGRNRRTVWTIPTQPFPEAHFATFPFRLVEPCIMAGTPPKCCGVCGAPWEAVVEASEAYKAKLGKGTMYRYAKTGPVGKGYATGGKANPSTTPEYKITGYRPTCDHTCPDPDDRGRSIVLDPFMGSGTVAVVAKESNRRYVGIEMNADYITMAETRLRQEVLDL